MTTFDIYLLGALGGFVAAVLVYVFPESAFIARTGNIDEITLPKILGILVTIAILSGIAGFGPLIAEEVPSNARDAILLGIGAQAALRSLVAAGERAVR